MTTLGTIDPELAECLRLEDDRQRKNLEMIASESVQPRLALELAGSVFNNKTAVGNPGKQRLKGSQYAEKLECLVADRACSLFEKVAQGVIVPEDYGEDPADVAPAASLARPSIRPKRRLLGRRGEEGI